MSLTDIPSPQDPLREERLDRQIAQDVALGESERAAQERHRANVYAREAAAQSVVASDARADRDTAVLTGAVAQNEARSAAFGFWMLLGIVALAVVIGAIWFANRPSVPVATTVVIDRGQPAAPAAPRVAQYQAPRDARSAANGQTSDTSSTQQRTAIPGESSYTGPAYTGRSDVAPVQATIPYGSTPPAALYTSRVPMGANGGAAPSTDQSSSASDDASNGS